MQCIAVGLLPSASASLAISISSEGETGPLGSKAFVYAIPHHAKAAADSNIITAVCARIEGSHAGGSQP
jgi:hypothetical protein